MSDAHGRIAEPVKRAEAAATDREVTIVLLSAGFVATTIVVMQSSVWPQAIGAAPLAVQCGLFVATVVVCVRRMVRTRHASWIALAGGAIATAAFWAIELPVLLALPGD